MANCMKQRVATLRHIRRFSAGADPKVWLIPSLAWRTQTAPSSSKDFKGEGPSRSGASVWRRNIGQYWMNSGSNGVCHAFSRRWGGFDQDAQAEA